MRFNPINLLYFAVLVLITSCMSLGINVKHKTPKKSLRLPVFTVKDSLLGYNNHYRSCYDVKYYDIHVKFNIAAKSIAGFATTKFELLKSSDKIQLDLDPSLVIDSITQDFHPLTYSRNYSAVLVNLLSLNKEQKITVYYHGKPVHARRPPWEGGFVWKHDKSNKPFISVACEGSGAQIWLPIKAWLGDEPDSVSMHFTVPKELSAVSNGNLISTKEEGNFKTYHWQTFYQVNPYNITFYIGDYKFFEEHYTCASGEEMNLRYYVLPENFEKAKVHFKQAQTILKVYEDLFGSYPWPKDGYKLVESPFAGMEHQTAIAYGNGYKNEKHFGFDYIIVHETAHEWWGNAVSVADFSDMWIHEGIATYAEALYVERTNGYMAYLNYMYWLSITVKNKKPVVGPTGVYYLDYKDGDPYAKGAVMLHTLRNHLNNDTLFFSIIKTFFKNNCYKSVTTKDFISLANQMSGKDLQPVFDQYLYDRRSPRLVWNFDYEKKLEKNQLIFKFERVVPCFSTPIQVEQGGNKFYIYPTSAVEFYTLPYPATVPVKVNSKGSYLEEGYKGIERMKDK